MADTHVAASVEADTHDVPHQGAGAHDAHAHGPTERQYWLVFVVLVAFTALEVAWSFFGLEGPVLVLPLVVMMVIKFLLVAGVFMHLYFDMNMINGKLFAVAFGSALALAAVVYMMVVATFGFRISGAF
jgi:cytochrome c oxidase subunit IV